LQRKNWWLRHKDVGITRIKLLPKVKAKGDSQIMATPTSEGLNKHKALWRNLRLLFGRNISNHKVPASEWSESYLCKVGSKDTNKVLAMFYKEIVRDCP